MATSRMAEQVGRVLGGRYRVLTPLGSGASAEVFLGDDVRLHRRVAVKLLHPGLADDAEFMRRFEAETRAAAALNHPNLLDIFDWSGAGRTDDGDGPRDQEPPYLITEYLQGGSLRAVLDAGHRLTPSQALLVGLQAVQGLDVAHRQGLVHRDLTPGNLLFGGDGRLRVGDIGLARAVADAAMTEPSGAVLGTARYASPEQVLGGSVSGESDIYALCLVMIEAVTGKVPFAADTTVGTLTARKDDPVPVPEEMDALVPLLERMGAVDAGDRPDAAGVAEALTEAATNLPRPAALPLVGQPTGRTEGRDDDDRTVVAGLPLAPAAPVAPTGPPSGPVVGPPAPPTGPPPGVPAGPPTGPPTGPPPVGPDDPLATQPLQAIGDDLIGAPAHVTTRPTGPPGAPPDRTAERQPLPGWVMPTVLTALALLVGAGGMWFVQRSSVPSHTVPESLIGADVGSLDDLIGDRGWRREIEREYAEDSVPGEILATEPSPGNDLREGDLLEVTVSCGPGLESLPPGMAGRSEDQAVQQLEQAGFDVEVERVHDDAVPDGGVIAVSTAEAEPDPECLEGEEADAAGGGEEAQLVPAGATVVLEVSDGPEQVEVPDVTGWDRESAVQQLEGLGFEVEVDRRRNREFEQGQAIRTEPAAGEEVDPGAEVTLIISRDGARGGDDDDDDDDDDDRDRVEVPFVFGMRVDEARDVLEDADLRVGNVDGNQNGRVWSQNPSAGSQVDEDTRINLRAN